MRKFFFIALILIFTGSAFAQYNPPAGEESYFRLLSPWMLGRGTSVVSTDAPAAAAWNPAAAAGTQRPTFDLGYVAIYDSEYDQGIAGHSMSLSGSHPSKTGVFTWGGHFLSADYEGLDLGSTFMANGGFAKDVYENLYVGGGLNIYLGSNDFFDYGATLDAGFIHFLGKYQLLNDFRWGLTAKDFGLWYNPSDNYSSIPSPFTLQLGGAFTPLVKEGFTLDVNADAALASMQNLRLTAGLQANIGQNLQIGLSEAVDFDDVIDGDFDTYRFIPSFGLRFSFQTNLSSSKIVDFSSKGYAQGDIQPQFGMAPLAGGAWGIGAGVSLPLGIIDKTPPEIEIDLGDLPYTPVEEGESETENVPVSLGSPFPVSPVSPAAAIKGAAFKSGEKSHGTQLLVQDSSKDQSGSSDGVKVPNELIKIDGAVYLSPNNDGTRDELVFPFKLNDTRYIKGYALEIYDAAGNLVRSIGNKEERPESFSFKDMFSRVFKTKSGIPVPDTLRWDGTTEEGAVAADGEYSFRVIAWDDNNNRSESPRYSIVIDTRPPEIEITEKKPLELIFSPDDDGSKDTVLIEQDGSLEETWTIAITAHGGREVFRKKISDAEPSDFVWDGRNRNGDLVADGVYTYTISAADRAGNNASKSVDNLIIDTRPRPVTINISNAWFSPNGDDVQDTVTLSPGVPSPETLRTWSISVLDAAGTVRWQQSGTTQAPGPLVFTGKADSGTVLPEGTYTARIEARYSNGNNPFSISPEFTLDITPPKASVSASPLIFSPNGDGNRDVSVITQDTSIEPEWISRIVDAGGNTVREYRWIETPDPEVVWNGTSANGEIAADGDYRYILTSVDRAGNSFSLETRTIRVSTGETVVALFPDKEAFSPNGDGKKDELLLKPQIKVAEGVESYTIQIVDGQSNVVKKYSGGGNLSDVYRWDGIGDDGQRAADGEYKARISLVDRNGTGAESVSQSFILDRVAPKAEIKTDYLLFSPNGDNSKDQVRIVQSGSSELLWQGIVKDSKGAVVRSYRWKGIPESFLWHGRDEAGNIAVDGEYTYQLSAEDPAGNSTSISLEGLRIDNRDTAAYLTSDSGKISPNNDGAFDTITFYPIVALSDGIRDWTLTIKDTAVKNYAVFSGDGTVPEEIVWNGADNEGFVRDGMYTPGLTVNYLKGDTPTAELKPLRVDASSPVVSMNATPLPFSPDNDGIDDELNFSISVDDLSPIKNWKLEIFDRQMNPFNTFSGEGTPKSNIIWDGRANNGELVIAAEDYPFRFSIEDDLGNTSMVNGSLPIDVLVIREGDKLKIQIASIVFEPNSAKFSQRDQQTADKNMFVLDRIAEILNKYRNYRITIEGHANPVYAGDPVRGPKEEQEELAPLSRDRAAAVRDSLIERGIHPGRLQVTGLGGTRTIADPADRDVNWKNRRVEFILEK